MENDIILTLFPVERREQYYIVSDEWLKAGLPFPGAEEAAGLLQNDYTPVRGSVHHDGQSYAATVYLPPTEDEQAFAKVTTTRNQTEDGTVSYPLPHQSSYLSRLQRTYEFSEGIIPDQRCRIESEFIEPIFALPSAGKSHVTWSQLKSSNYLLIIGAPGSGKTTLLRHWVLWHARRLERNESEVIPVYFSLRHWHAGDTFEGTIRQGLLDSDGEWLAGNFKSLANEGRLAFGIDGTDEVPLEERNNVLEEIQRFTLQFPKCKYMVTSRPESQPGLSIGLDPAYILPFSHAQSRELVYHKLYESGTWKLFCARIEAEETLDDFASNPLSLSLILARYLRHEFVPSFVTEVLSELVEMLVDRWDSSRGIVRVRKAGLSPDRKIKILNLIGRFLSERNKSSFVVSDLSDELQKVVSEFTPYETLKFLEEHTGILQQKENGGWEFRNSVFEEYCISNSWTSALANKVDPFLDEMLGPVQKSPSLRARFLVGMSSDASAAIDETLRRAVPGSLDSAINLAAAFTQRVAVSDGILAGYAQYISNVLLNRIESQEIKVDCVPGKDGSKWHLELTFDPSPSLNLDLSSLALLLSMLHKGRDGSGNATLAASLRLSGDSRLAYIGELLRTEGLFVVHNHPGRLTASVKDLMPELENGPTQPAIR